MADKAGLLPYRDVNARQQGAPGMDWKVDEALAPGRAAGEVFRGLMAGANALDGFLRERQDTEDRLCMVQLRNLHDQVYGDLDDFIREQPGATDEDVAARRDDAGAAFEEGAQDIYRRMSGQARSLAREHAAAWTMDGDRRRAGVRRQAQVTGMLAQSRAEEERLLANGNFDDYKAYVESQTGLYSGEQIAAKVGELPRLRQEWQVRNMLDMPDTSLPALARDLGERDKDGHWVNYTDMSPEYRAGMLREIGRRMEDMARADDDAFLASVTDGEPLYTAEQLKARRDAGELSDARYVRMARWLEDFERRREAEEREAYETAEGYLRDWAADAKEERRELAEEEKARIQGEWEEFQVDVARAEKPGDLPATMEELDARLENGELTREEYLRRRRLLQKALDDFGKGERNARSERERDAADSLKYEAAMAVFPVEPAANRRLLNHYRERAMDAIGDPALLRSTLEWLDKEAEDGLAGRGAFSTPDGQMVRRYIQDSFVARNGEFTGLKWDPWGWGKEDSQEFMQARYHEVVEVAAQMLEKGKSPAEIMDFIDGQADELNAGRIRSILDGAGRYYTRPTSPDGKGPLGRLKDRLGANKATGYSDGAVRIVEINGEKMTFRRDNGGWFPVLEEEGE
jgi:hypothetical protein